MNSEGGAPSFEMPGEGIPAPEKPVEQAPSTMPEQLPARQEAGVGKKAPQATTASPTDVAIPDSAKPIVPTDDSQSSALPQSPATSDLPAADRNVIEKEWVERTKSIAGQTKNDPHRQKSELSRAKADYIHKRFNKIIKTDPTGA